jgi:hypothetical protein
MAVPSPAFGRSVADDQEPANRRWSPSEALAADVLSQPMLLVEPPDELLDRDELRFDLDDDGGACSVMGGEDVNRTSLAVSRIRDLENDLPAVMLEDPAGIRSSPACSSSSNRSRSGPRQLSTSDPRIFSARRIERTLLRLSVSR